MYTRLSTPSLGGATQWLNTRPLGLAELRGQVVLVNFCTLTCINWLRTVPYLRAWASAYRDSGLVVVGIHTPEFSFERDPDLVRRALMERMIDYPVAVDNDYEIWRAFHNRFWPALYFLDAEGAVRDQHFGEGQYEQCERILQRLLGTAGDLVSVAGAGVEAAPDWDHLRTPETYLGYGRSTGTGPGGLRDRPSEHQLPAHLARNHWALDGTWTVAAESVRLDEPDGSIAFRFHARDAHLVLSPGSRHPAPFQVRVDGKRPGSSHGVDTDEDGYGLLGDGRLYQLVRARGAVTEQTLQITFREPGVAAYAFTFG
jgi:thiol-disulfide isomerase/thioredoxin